MKQRFFFRLTCHLPRALVLLLCLALLAGCSGAPATSDSSTPIATGKYEFIDSSAPSFVAPPQNTAAAPAKSADISTLPLEELLPQSKDFAILFVNVGKADAAILRFGETAVLIDTGTAESAPQLIAGLNALGITHLSAVFITHNGGDHLGGLDALSANYDIPMVYSPFFSEADKNGIRKIVKQAQKLHLPHAELKAGDVVPITIDVSFAVLGPLSLNEVDDNDNSLVLQFAYKDVTFLFTGDMQFPEEQEIIASGATLKSDVLKVGNHGNPDATGDDFSALVSPEYAVISTNTMVDKDSANPRVYAALPMAQIVVTEDYPIGVLLTLDESGAVTISNPAREASDSPVWVGDFDVEAQTITLFNSGTAPADLSGMILFSIRSGATLRFPEGTVLGTEASLTVGESGDFSFKGEDKPLKKKNNTVILYDRFGTLISKLEQ
jgi:competence protein ComEC